MKNFIKRNISISIILIIAASLMFSMFALGKAEETASNNPEISSNYHSDVMDDTNETQQSETESQLANQEQLEISPINDEKDLTCDNQALINEFENTESKEQTELESAQEKTSEPVAESTELAEPLLDSLDTPIDAQKELRNQNWRLVCYEPYTTNRLPNVEMELRNLETGKIYFGSSNEKGVSYPKIPTGSYQIYESNIPEPYFYPGGDPTQPVEFYLPNDQDTAYTTLYVKQDGVWVAGRYWDYLDIPHQWSRVAIQTLGEDGATLVGTQLALYNQAGDIVKIARSDNYNGKALAYFSGLNPGIYTVREQNTDKKYLNPARDSQANLGQIKINNDGTSEIVADESPYLVNDGYKTIYHPKRNSLTLETLDQDGKAISGVKIKLVNQATGQSIEGTSKNGQVSFDELAVGSYIIQEFDTPEPYATPAGFYATPLGSLTIEKDGYAKVSDESQFITSETRHHKIYHSETNQISFKTVVIESDRATTSAKYVPFILEQYLDGKWQVREDIMTNLNGVITLKNLADGGYRLIENSELQPKTGYKLMEQSHYQNNGIVRFFYVKKGKFNLWDYHKNDWTALGYKPHPADHPDLKINYTRTTQIYLRVNKVDETGKRLENAEFTIKSSNQDGKTIFEKTGLRTNSNGVISIEDVKKGKISIQETEAPAGYLINPEELTVELNQNFSVPSDCPEARDVSQFISIDTFETRDNEVNPIQSEILNITSIIKISEEGRFGTDKIKPGDYFTYYYDGPVSLGGIIPDGNGFQDGDVYDAIGKIAEGESFVTPEGRRGYKYTFTDYVDLLSLREKMHVDKQLYIDLYKQLYSGKIDISSQISAEANAKAVPLTVHGSPTNQVSVNYSGGTGTQSIVTIGSKIMKLNEDEKFVEEISYINPTGKRIFNLKDYIITSDEADFINQATDITIYRVDLPNKNTMPVSFGADLSDNTTYQDVTDQFQINKNPEDKIIIPMKGKANQGEGYIIKAVYHYGDSYQVTKPNSISHKQFFGENGWIEYHTHLQMFDATTEEDGYIEVTVMNKKEPQNQVEFVKQGFNAQGQLIKEALSGVVFKVEYQDEAGNWQLFTQAPCNQEGLLTTGEDGKLTFNNLNTKTSDLVKYRIFEEKAAPGYVLPDISQAIIEFQVNPDPERTITITKNQTQTAEQNSNIIKNRAVEYPATGGIGQIIFLVAGGIIMLIAYISYHKSISEE